MSLIGRSGALAPALTAITQNVPCAARPLAPAVALASSKISVDPERKVLTSSSMYNSILSLRNKATTHLAAMGQYRFAHSDIQVPDFSFYRRDSTKDPKQSAKTNVATRNIFTYLMVGGTSIPLVYGAKTVVTQFVSSMSASADVLALAKIEVKLADIPEGKNVTFKWRGKPLFVRHRTDEEVETEKSVDVSSLRDPQHDSERVKDEKWLVLIGVCTHLGCVPIANAGAFGGYYCPCHGSHYDASGRIRQGPAPLNLEIPYYEFIEDGETLVVG